MDRPGTRPDGHGHPALLVNLLSLVASEVSLLQEVHAAEERFRGWSGNNSKS